MTPTEAAAELQTVTTALAELPGEIIDAAVIAAERAILDSVLGQRGSLTLSGLNATLGIASTVEVAETSASAKLEATPQGPWAMVESGTKRHEQNRRGSRGVSRAMPTPYGYKSRVTHPGTSGLGVWAPATANADVAVDQAARDVMAVELPRH